MEYSITLVKTDDGYIGRINRDVPDGFGTDLLGTVIRSIDICLSNALHKHDTLNIQLNIQTELVPSEHED